MHHIFLFKTALMHRYEGLAKSNKITCSTRRKGHTENSSINNLQFSVYPPTFGTAIDRF